MNTFYVLPLVIAIERVLFLIFFFLVVLVLVFISLVVNSKCLEEVSKSLIFDERWIAKASSRAQTSVHKKN